MGHIFWNALNPMGNITFVGNPSVTVNASKQYPFEYQLRLKSAGSTGSLFTNTVPITVNVTTPNSYPFTNDSITGVNTVTGVICNFANEAGDDIKFTMTFKFNTDPSNITIDSSTVRITFTKFILPFSDNYVTDWTCDDIKNYTFHLPYVVYFGSQVYSTGIADGTVKP